MTVMDAAPGRKPPAGGPPRRSPHAFHATKSHVTAPNALPYAVSNAFDLSAHSRGSSGGKPPAELAAPRRAFFGGHSIAEAGGSMCAAVGVLLLLRAAMLAAGILTAVLAIPSHHLALSRLHSVPFYAFVVSTAVNVTCSLVFLLGRTPEASLPAYYQGSKNTSLANIAVPLHQFAFTLALFSAPLVWAFLEPPGSGAPFPFAKVLTFLLPVACMLTDTVLALRHRYKLFYTAFPILFATIYIAAYALRPTSLYTALSKDQHSNSRVSMGYGIIAAWGLLSAFVAYGISRALACARRADQQLREDMHFARDKRLYDDEGNVHRHVLEGIDDEADVSSARSWRDNVNSLSSVDGKLFKPVVPAETEVAAVEGRHGAADFRQYTPDGEDDSHRSWRDAPRAPLPPPLPRYPEDASEAASQRYQTHQEHPMQDGYQMYQGPPEHGVDYTPPPPPLPPSGNTIMQYPS